MSGLGDGGPVSGPATLGIDLGGTKIAAAVLGPDGAVLWQDRIGTPRHDYRATVEAIAGLVEAADLTVGTILPVGIGMPGAISPATGLVKNANSTWLNGQPFQRDIETRLGRRVWCANDANCLAVSEAVDGAAAGAHLVFGVILGTGTGGGIAIDGKVVTGANAIAGEWGHNPLPWPTDAELPGPACYCGRHGCLETWLSGPGLAAHFARRTGTTLPSEAVVARANTGDTDAAAAVEAWLDRLARGLAVIINVLDPDVIVVGGGLSEVDAIYTAVPRLWTRWVFSDRVETRLVAARYGAASGVRGAAWLPPVGGLTEWSNRARQPEGPRPC
jgi:fructokinase